MQFSCFGTHFIRAYLDENVKEKKTEEKSESNFENRIRNLTKPSNYALVIRMGYCWTSGQVDLIIFVSYVCPTPIIFNAKSGLQRKLLIIFENCPKPVLTEFAFGVIPLIIVLSKVPNTRRSNALFARGKNSFDVKIFLWCKCNEF